MRSQVRLVPAAHQIKFRRPARGRAAHQPDRLDERSPVLGGRRRRLEFAERLRRIGWPGDAIKDFGRRRRPRAGQQLNHAEAGKAVARVFRPAQERQQILDVRGFEKLQSAELDEGNVAPGQLHFERAAVVRSAEQDRLRLEREPGLAARQHRLHHVARLVRLVAHADDLRALG